MGLASALSTSLTGLTAAETTIDVVGNNLANSQTVGFKESSVVFATQFLQTLSLGSSPTADRGGTNPRQTGLGTQVAEISPNFSQGTIEISANPSDLAIQGDGFFIVQSSNAGEQLYTRNGIFKTNSGNELVTSTGQRLLGFGVDDDFNILRTTLVPISIPLGSAAVAQATRNVHFEGTLSPTAELADRGEIIQTGVLGDAGYTAPEDTTTATLATAPAIPGTFAAASGAGGGLTAGEYVYRFVYADAVDATIGPFGSTSTYRGETAAATTARLTVNPGDDQLTLTNLPPATADYTRLRVYRTAVDPPAGPTEFYFVGEVDLTATTTLVDTTSDAVLLTQPPQDTTSLTGSFDYFVVFADTAGGPGVGLESRPSARIDGVTVVGGRIRLEDLPLDTSGQWAVRRIYRSVPGSNGEYHFVAEIPNNTDTVFTDRVPTSVIEGTAALDFDGPRITLSSLLSNLQTRSGETYSTPFEVGATLQFTPQKGGHNLVTRSLEITSSTTIGDLVRFLEQSAGIQTSPSGDSYPIPDSITATGNATPGGSVTADGRIRLVSNNGQPNAVTISLSSLRQTTAGVTGNLSLPFETVQRAAGEGTTADFIVYDSLGIPLPIHVTTVLEARDGLSTTYRWFADSAANDPATGAAVAVGTGLIIFDGEGNVTNVTNSAVNVLRETVSSASPLNFDLHFENLSGLSAARSILAASGQDGSSAGVLSSFIIGEDGGIRGVFSNGVTRDLGEIVLARFSNPVGLEQRGQNLFAAGVNSGLPVVGSPGQQGLGTLVAGAVELSNTDVGRNLIDLILASSQYRSNTRVITTAQQLLDELLNLRR